MIQEILTLVVDRLPIPYYINFEKNRKKFHFQPTLKNKSAPSFFIVVDPNGLTAHELSDPEIEIQAMEKVREILSNTIFDNF